MDNKYIKIVYKAVAQIRSFDDTKILGYVKFHENINGGTHIFGELNGLPFGEHGIHIHEYGDPREYYTFGDHYNPYDKQHGDKISKERHVGDMGNIKFDEFGKCKFSFIDNQIRINGEYNVIGRSVIINKYADDLGLGNFPDSKETGHSGNYIAYGIIGHA